MPEVDALAIEQLHLPSSVIYRRVDIYEEDGETLWMEGAPLVGGKVSVDSTRQDARRNIDLELLNEDGALDHHPNGFWYDKIIRPFRGFEKRDGELLCWPLGDFVIDRIRADNFPSVLRVTGRDLTKRLLTSKLPTATSFNVGTPIELVVKAMLINGGITKMILPVTGKTTGRVFMFEAGTKRWDAIHEVCQAYGYDHYFDANGVFVMSEFRDPSSSPVIFSFETGDNGTISKYSKSVGDSRIYNHIVVRGEATDIAPVFAEARNTNPGSPTSIAAIGERTYEFVSSFITSVPQAQEVADNFLKVHALEEWVVDLDTLVVPWLEAGEIVEFLDPTPYPDQPTRFLLSSFNIPLDLSLMSFEGRRVEIV